MDIRTLSPTFSVTPQIEPADLPAIKDAGFGTVICNRPDGENPLELQAEVLRIATEAAGLAFVENPATPGAMTMENVETQAIVQTESTAPVLAYCASGTRSSILWALSQAGEMDTVDIVKAAAEAGYDLSGFAGQIDMLAARK